MSFAGQVLGQRRFGVRLCSLLADLRIHLRVPLRQLRDYLALVHQLDLSVGALDGLIQAVAQHGTSTVAALKDAIRGSPVVHADETGWREGGQNGYIWSFSTDGPQAIRCYQYDHSRSGRVARMVLGGDFRGHLVTDVYAAYNQFAGPHQRCWAHLLRDLRALQEQPGQAVAVRRWAVQVAAVYQLAQLRLRQHPALTAAARVAFAARLMARIHALGQQYATTRKHPCQALAKRLVRHEAELFAFVRVEGVAATNNLAERSVRPLVIARTISGGSRSATGSDAYMALASLFGTWRARQQNPLAACLQLLTA